MQKENEHRMAFKEWIRWMGDTCTDLGGIKDAYNSGKRRIKAGIHLSGSVSATIRQTFKPSDLIIKPLYYSTV